MQTADLKVSTGVSLSVSPMPQHSLPLFTDMDVKVDDKIEEELTSTDMFVRERAVLAYSLTEAQQERALKDTAWKVRLAAVEKGGLTKAQIERGLQDECLAVADAVMRVG